MAEPREVVPQLNRRRPEDPLVAIDLDDHAFPFTHDFIRWHDETLGSSFTDIPRTTFYYEDDFGVSTDHILQMIDAYFISHAQHNDPYEGADEAFRRMKEHVELFVLTARPGVLREASVKQVTNHFPGLFTDVFCTDQFMQEGIKPSKGEICRRLGAIALLDDADHNVNSAVQNGLMGILVGEFENNRLQLVEGVVVVDNLEEAADVVIEEFGRK